MSEKHHVPALSVVIIGRNEGARLVRCIESVNAMRFPSENRVGQVANLSYQFSLLQDVAKDAANDASKDVGQTEVYPRSEMELIYVDSDSTDGSAETAAAMGAKVIVVKPKRPTAALGRNAGWRAATAPLVLFLDGDTILHPDFVAQAVQTFADPQVAVVWGHRRELHPEASIYNRVLDLDWVYPPGPVEFCGGDALMRRSVLEAVNGYDETLIAGEEPEMCRWMRASGYTILHLDLPMTGHDLAMTRWSQYWRRAFRAGHAYAEVAERFRGTELPLWEREVKRTVIHGGLVLLLFTFGGIASLAFFSPWPFLAALGAFFLLAVRTALKVGWKSNSRATRLFYGVHSHLQQIPILCGQLSYWFDKQAGRQQRLIEYKEPSQ